MSELSERDREHLQECYNAFGVAESVRNGHMTMFKLDDDYLKVVAEECERLLRILEKASEDAINNG